MWICWFKLKYSTFCLSIWAVIKQMIKNIMKCKNVQVVQTEKMWRDAKTW